MAKVVVKFKNKIIKEVAIGPQGVKVGRDPDNDIQIDNVAVSRFHAKIYRGSHPFYVEDLDSTNGTYLNGTLVNWKSALSHNDKITMGKHTLVFIEEPKDTLSAKQKQKADETFCLTKDELAKLLENE